MGKFWESVGGKLAERWAAVSVPALVFWLGGLLAWTRARGGPHAWEASADWLGRQPGGAQAVVLLALLCAVGASGVVIDRLTRPMLALLEGYWPAPLRPVRRQLTERVRRKARAAGDEFQTLAGPVHDGSATPEQRARYTRVDRRLRRLPTGPRLLPTRLGNVLRAAETRPIDKYGLDAVVVWPHLWLLLPDAPRSELAAARRSLDASVGACVWGILFTAFTPWTLWALPIGLAVALAATFVWAPAKAEVFADLLEASFDLHRGALYTQLRWPLPDNPADERIKGRRITTYLMRGLDGASPTFTGGEPPAAVGPGSGATGTSPPPPASTTPPPSP
ncbi:hypothetical protein ACH4SP_28125 [Streptomyces sp. NPDC021093]|uniref:hypothetical protein n=1 Tax=Streptomyces sp. NPDC021093 TaxID=3365112 RepID=UPI00379877E4